MVEGLIHGLEVRATENTGWKPVLHRTPGAGPGAKQRSGRNLALDGG